LVANGNKFKTALKFKRADIYRPINNALSWRTSLICG
jgi:hypothetical protein